MYQVEWIQSALDELTNLWTLADAAERQEITAASHLIEQRLRRSPLTEGESRRAGRRIAFAAPLVVTFRVEADGRTVTVLGIRFFRRRMP